MIVSEHTVTMSLCEQRQFHSLWKLLHTPFILPPNCAEHEHQWECIASGVVACKICSNIHECSDSCESYEIEDGRVCVITGVVVYNKKFCEEFSENIGMEGCIPYNVMEEIEKQHYLVKEYVHEILTSRGAYRAWNRDMAKREAKAHQSVVQYHSQARMSGQVPCLVSCVQMYAQEHKKNECSWQGAFRKNIAAKIVCLLRPLLAICQQRYGLKVKENEFMQFIFGMVCLLRTGVKVHSYYILPKDNTNKISALIANESSLALFTSFKCKCITDAENRFKYIFRNMTVDEARFVSEEINSLW